MKTPILSTEAVWKSFTTGRHRLLTLQNINLSLNKGEFICIVGPSGCGKSTLLQILGGLLPASRGKVFFGANPLKGTNPAIGLVFQKPNLMPWRTVLQNVLLPLELKGIHSGLARDIANKALAKIGLEEFHDAYPKTLSGGMEQRLALARTLVTRPQVVLLDEPFAALDALTRERLNLELLRLWRSQNLTAVMVTHDIREAVFFSDRVLIMSPRPATFTEEFIIDLPRPRPENIEYTNAFGEYALRIRQAIKA